MSGDQLYHGAQPATVIPNGFGESCDSYHCTLRITAHRQPSIYATVLTGLSAARRWCYASR
jgi:hypothetical protein